MYVHVEILSSSSCRRDSMKRKVFKRAKEKEKRKRVKQRKTAAFSLPLFLYLLVWNTFALELVFIPLLSIYCHQWKSVCLYICEEKVKIMEQSVCMCILFGTKVGNVFPPFLLYMWLVFICALKVFDGFWYSVVAVMHLCYCYFRKLLQIQMVQKLE